MTENISQPENEPPRRVFTEEFIQNTNSVLGKFGDDTKIVDFYVRSEKSAKQQGRRVQQEVLNHNLSINPPSEWLVFLDSLEPYQKGPLIDAVARILDAGYETFGQIRSASVEEIANKQPRRRINLIGQKRAEDIKSMLKPAELPQD